MSLFGRLTEKSWETPGTDLGRDPLAARPPAARVGLYVYFAVAFMLFLLVTAAYLMRMGMSGMGHGGMYVDWRPMPELPLLYVNTAILVLDSFAWETARRGAARGRADMLRMGLHAGGALAILFVAGQLLLWRQFAQLGYFAADNPANAFFYFITALHALHVLGGLYFWGRTLARARRGAGTAELRLPVALCATYWHFLLAVWAVMLGLFMLT